MWCSMYLEETLQAGSRGRCLCGNKLVYFIQCSKILILGKYKLYVYIVAPRAASKNTRDRLKNTANTSRWDSKGSSSNPQEVRKGKYKKGKQRRKGRFSLNLSMMTLSVNGLNAPVKRQRLKRGLKTTHAMI